MALLPYLDVRTILVATILLFSYYLLRRYKSAKAKRAPEASGGWPVIGHLPLLAGPELPHTTLTALADKHGPIFTIRIGLYPAVVVSSWELAKEIFTTNDLLVCSRPKLTSFKLLGYNYANFGFSPYGDYWVELRKITALELLSSRRLELLKHVRASEVEGAIQDLYQLWMKNKNESGRVLVEMKRWFSDINMNTILRMIAGKRYYGASAAADETEARRFQKAMRDFFRLAGVFLPRDAIPFLGWLDLGGYEKAMKRTAEEFDSVVEDWLKEHQRRKDSGEAANQEQDFMDVLLSVIDQGTNLAGYDADTVRKATAMTLLAGGSDTTTVTITWALALLLNNPAALLKAQEELDTQVGKERLVNELEIDKLVYIQAIVKEALRLYPAGPLSGPREFTEDCTIGGYHIPAGTRLVLNIHQIQRDPRVWSNPMEFKPERFLSTHKDIDVKGQHFELVPFGAGRRACPGINFGVKMTQLVLASFLQAFDVSTPSNLPVDMAGSAGLTNCKATPLDVFVKPRLSANFFK